VDLDSGLTTCRRAIVLRLKDVDRGSRAPRSSDVLREEIIDEGLVAEPTPLGFAPYGVKNLGIDPNRD
jgi:hypothetical protein